MFRIFRAELRRVFILVGRYPLESISRLVWNLSFAFVFYAAVGAVAGPAARDAQLDRLLALLVSYVAINGLSNATEFITVESQTGTLEQALLSPRPLVQVAVLRDAANFVELILRFGLVLAIAQLVTGRAFHVEPVGLVTLLTLMFLGNEGMGLVLGALTLLFKRTATLVQGAIGLVFAFTLFPPSTLTGWAAMAATLFPFAHAVRLLQQQAVRGVPFAEMMAHGAVFSLALVSVSWFLAGVGAFALADRLGRRRGTIASW